MLNSVSVTENGNTTTENIVYDQIGNPTTYRNASLTWFGRQLTNYSKSGTTASFTYDADGLRGKKTVNGTTSVYQYVNGHLAYEKRGNVQYFYFYDSFGKLSSIRFYDPSVSNGSAQNYFTLTNQQGDVVAIYNVAGTKVASYEYDAWGNIISTTDTSGVNISTRNPFRYRGYYYDQETGLYYLQSRYYDPEIGRFINADSQLNNTSVLGYNPFAYCENNPVNSIDSDGTIMVMMYDGGGGNGNIQSSVSSNTVAIVTGNVNTIPDHPNYHPPKKWDGRKKLSPSGKKGWPAKDGSTWVWNPNMHGGPGWVIEYPDGSHKHAYPDGGIREHSKKISLYSPVEGNVGVSALCVVAIGIIVIDDLTGVGVADDALIPVLSSCLVTINFGSSLYYCKECGGVYFES